MPYWLWVEVGIVGGLLAAVILGGIGYIAFRRGLKLQVKDVFLDIPGPDTKVLREKNSTRAYVKDEYALQTAMRMATVLEEQKNLKQAFLPRALEKTEDRFDTFLYQVDAEFEEVCCEDPTPAWEDAFPAITGNLRRRLVEERFKPSFLFNGFYDYKTLGTGGEIGVTRAWTDYIEERVESIKAFMQHYLKNKVGAKVQIQKIVASLESGPLRLALHDAISDIYDWYWTLHHQMKQQDRDLQAEYVALLNGLKGAP